MKITVLQLIGLKILSEGSYNIPQINAEYYKLVGAKANIYDAMASLVRNKYAFKDLNSVYSILPLGQTMLDQVRNIIQ